MSCEIDDNNYVLRPFRGGEKQLEFLERLLTTSGVYETLRDGKPWTEDLVVNRALAYTKGVEEVAQGDFVYNSDSFTMCWVLYTQDDTPIGRGGF